MTSYSNCNDFIILPASGPVSPHLSFERFQSHTSNTIQDVCDAIGFAVCICGRGVSCLLVQPPALPPSPSRLLVSPPRSPKAYCVMLRTIKYSRTGAALAHGNQCSPLNMMMKTHPLASRIWSHTRTHPRPDGRSIF